MIPVKDIYESVTLDDANSDENGHMPFDMFNRMSKRAELRLLDWLTGDVAGVAPPEPYLTQKNKDWVAPFLVKKTAQVQNGALPRPDDYYKFESLMKLEGARQDCDGEEEGLDGCGVSIPILDSDKFIQRCNSHIKRLRPSDRNPIAKQIEKRFEFLPKDVGSVQFEYIRKPKFARIVGGINSQFNEPVILPESENYEWDEFASGLLIWFIVDTFSNHTSNQATKQFNQATGKTVQRP